MKDYFVIERAGLIKIFEFTFELGWNTLKDFWEEQGQIVKFPREVRNEFGISSYF